MINEGPDSLRAIGAFVGTERFLILRELGVGGMGAVYAALDRERRITVALKTLREISPDGLFRFKREFREFRDLHHPHLVSLHELHCEAGTWFFTMDFVEGVDFVSWVRPAEALDERRLREALRQLVLAALALHDAGKVHRDIKPSNIVVTAEGRLVLLDFGIAGDAARRSTDAVLGTIAYMAPEQALGELVGPAADWYAIGVMLYEALTGQLPISGSTYSMLLSKLNLANPHPRALAPEVPEDLDQLCAELLATRPESRPSGRLLLERLAGNVAPAPSGLQFVGRVHELEALATQFEGSVKGLRALALSGESGVGKTELVRHFLRLVSEQDRECIVLSGRCHQREQLPFQAVDGWMDALSTTLRQWPASEVSAVLPERIELLAQAFPVLGRVDAIARAPRAAEAPQLRERRKLTFAVFRELLVELAQRRRVLLFIDDLHWIDEDSSALLTTLLHEAEAPGVMLLATVRSEEQSLPLLRRFQQLGVERLVPADAHRLVELLSGSASSTNIDALRIATQSAGHPLFIDVLVRHAEELGDYAASLEEALDWEVRRLPSDPRRVLELVCVAASPLSLEAVAHAAELPRDGVQGPTSELCRRHLLRSSGGGKQERVEPYHARIRGAVLASLEPHELRARHAELAASLERTAQPDPSALFGHFRAAGDVQRASHFALLAGERAAHALAFDQAAALYQECLTLHREPQPELLARIAEALANAGRGEKSAEAYLGAAACAAEREVPSFRRRAAEQLLRTGHVDRGLDVLGSVLSAAKMSLPATPEATLRALVLGRLRLWLRGTRFEERAPDTLPRSVIEQLEACWTAATGLASIDWFRALHFQTQHLLLALEAGHTLHIVRGLAMDAACLSLDVKSGRKRSEQRLAQARELAQHLQSSDVSGLLGTLEVAVTCCQGRFREARQLRKETEAFLRERCRGATWELDITRFFGVAATYWNGDLSALRREVSEVVHDSEARGDLFALVTLRTVHGPFLALFDDDPARARLEIESALALWSRRDFHVQHMQGVLSMTQVELYESKPDRALLTLKDAQSVIERSQLLRLQFYRIWVSYLRGCAAVALGDVRSALAEAKRLQREGGWGVAFEHILRAGCARPDARAAAWSEAARRSAQLDLDLFAACARSRAGDPSGAAWLDSAGVKNRTALVNAHAPLLPD